MMYLLLHAGIDAAPHYRQLPRQLLVITVNNDPGTQHGVIVRTFFSVRTSVSKLFLECPAHDPVAVMIPDRG